MKNVCLYHITDLVYVQHAEAQHQRQVNKAVQEAEQRKENEKQQALNELRQSLEKRMAEAEASVEEYKTLYTKENRMRKVIHNKLLELQVRKNSTGTLMFQMLRACCTGKYSCHVSCKTCTRGGTSCRSRC